MNEQAKQVAQLHQRSERGMRDPKPHSFAGGRIEHPGGQLLDNARLDFQVDDCAVAPPLCVLDREMSAEQRMPPVVDDSSGADMGRMDVRLSRGAKSTRDPDRSMVARSRRCSTASCRAVAKRASTRAPTCSRPCEER